MKTDGGVPTAFILGRELAAYPFKLPKFTAADRWRLRRYGVFQEVLGNNLIGFVLLLYAFVV